MDNLRKTNAFFGSIINDVNTDMSDKEINSMMNMTLGGIIDALIEMPDEIKRLTFDDLMTICLTNDNEEIERIFTKCFDEEPTEERMNEFIEGLMKFSEIIGIDFEEDS